MQCQICGKEPGEYECSVCGKIVCENHHKTINGKVYCTEHVPKKPVSPGLKSAIYTVFILLVGVLIVSYILNNTIKGSSLFTNIIPLTSGFATFSNLIVIALSAILAVLIIVYLILSRKYK